MPDTVTSSGPPMNPEALKKALGTCLTRARKHVSELLKKKAMDIPFQDENLRELLLHHPRKKIKDFRYFARRSMPPYFRPCLTVSLPDKTFATVSWTHCLQNLYGKNDPERNKRQRAVHAFREAIAESPRMAEAREKFGVGKCSGCGKRTKLHIDHDETPFAQLLDNFLESKGLKLNKVTIDFRTKPYSLMSKRLTADWIAYHDKHATLQGLCKICNSSKGSGGYRHKV